MKRISLQICSIVLSVTLALPLMFNSTKVYAASDNKKEYEDNVRIMVSLGDSYSSGEGIPHFYGYEKDLKDRVKDQNWLAHRSENSWPGQLTMAGVEGKMADEGNREVHWFFRAISGAETKHISKENFKKKYSKNVIYTGSKELDKEIDVFKDIPKNETDYVTMTMGGNDVGFSKIITTCILSGEYFFPNALKTKFDKTWVKFEEETKWNLKDVYYEIADAAGPQAHIIIAGYPKLLDEGDNAALGKLGFRSEEAKRVNENVTEFNARIKQIVNTCKSSGMNIEFVDVEEAFENNGGGAYASDALINPVIAGSQEEDIADVAVASAYSIHPNAEGAEVYRSCVQEEINRYEEHKYDDINLSDEKNLAENPEASEDEKEKKAKHFSGVVLQPEDVVLKMFDALESGDYETAAECLDPATEQQLDFWGGIASSIVSLFTGEYISWGQLVLEAAGATDVEVIECNSANLVYESNFDLLSEWLPKIPGLKNLVCTEADVRVKYRYTYEGVTRIEEESYHVRRYEWSGWRIEDDVLH